MNQSHRHRQGRPERFGQSFFTGINPPSNSDRYAAWISRLGRMPAPVSRRIFPWQRKANVVPFKKEQDDAA